MPHRRNSIVLRGVGVRARCKDEDVERNMGFHHFLQVSQRLLATIIAPEGSKLMLPTYLFNYSPTTITVEKIELKISSGAI